MSEVLVGLGSNLGDRAAMLRAALRGLERLPRTRLRACSRLRPSAPVGGPPQPGYLNGAVRLETGLGPRELLGELLALERRLGRRRGQRWGPRTVDLDLLLYQDWHEDGPLLTVPHPRLAERGFVLRPLAEIAPLLRLPDGRTPGQALHDLAGAARGGDGGAR